MDLHLNLAEIDTAPDELLLKTSSTPMIAPEHVTFKGGRGEPFHDWYSYLEGFSPAFVKHQLSSYMPQAGRIIEPFAGTGTTPMVLSTLGVDCGYCEVNPAMRLLIDVKEKVGKLGVRQRSKLSGALTALATTLDDKVTSAVPHDGLHSRFAANFTTSLFFSDDAYAKVLALRTLNDDISAGDPVLGGMLTVAVMSRLVQCSNLKRAGDVRYKTPKELAKGLPCIVAETRGQLLRMAGDCMNSESMTGKLSLLTTNAKDLVSYGDWRADGVITSPPYLNGTNYFRNTKLELWYCGHLSAGTTLRSYRDLAITAGINDVGASKGRTMISASVAKLVDELSERAYDKRIPRMVAGYFEDMRLVLQGLKASCKPGATMCIDIGDSRYGGVHVPTHTILAEIAVEMGLLHIETAHLRARTSKDGSMLSQSLIVLRKDNGESQ